MLRRWGNTVILLQQSLFDTWNTSQGLIPRVSNTAVLSCLLASHTESASVWNAEGCDKAGVVWRPGMRTCLKFKISLDKLGVLLMLLMSYFQRGLTWWVAVRQRADEENKERVWLELNTQPKPQRDRRTSSHLQHGLTAHVWLFWALMGRRGEASLTEEGERETEALDDVRLGCRAHTGRERGNRKSKWAFSDYIFAKWD